MKLKVVEDFEGNTNELARAKYILAYLQSGRKADAAYASKLSVKAHARIVEMFSLRGHAFDAHRPGRPVKYTDTLMEAAYEKLITWDQDLLTGAQLLRHLIGDRILQPGSDIDTFLSHLRAYIKGQGHRLITNSTKTQFFIAVSDVGQRLKYANTMLVELRETHLEYVIYG
jgi:hypothetical protein